MLYSRYDIIMTSPPLSITSFWLILIQGYWRLNVKRIAQTQANNSLGEGRLTSISAKIPCQRCKSNGNAF